MKVFVDYTNWKGIREWREIEPETDTTANFMLCMADYPLEGDPDGKSCTTLVMHVKMPDRGGARRTLRADHIHGFKLEA